MSTHALVWRRAPASRRNVVERIVPGHYKMTAEENRTYWMREIKLPSGSHLHIGGKVTHTNASGITASAPPTGHNAAQSQLRARRGILTDLLARNHVYSVTIPTIQGWSPANGAQDITKLFEQLTAWMWLIQKWYAAIHRVDKVLTDSTSSAVVDSFATSSDWLTTIRVIPTGNVANSLLTGGSNRAGIIADANRNLYVPSASSGNLVATLVKYADNTNVQVPTGWHQDPMRPHWRFPTP